jgi:hypothetical protein
MAASGAKRNQDRSEDRNQDRSEEHVATVGKASAHSAVDEPAREDPSGSADRSTPKVTFTKRLTFRDESQAIFHGQPHHPKLI